MTEQTYEGCEIPIYSVKDSRKFKDIQARLLFNLCETSMMEKVEWWKMCVTLLFLIAADWFSPIIASKVVCIWFLGIVV